MNFYKHHLGDYAAATSHLSWDEDCAYRRLMDQYYKREAPLPPEMKDAWRLARASTPTQKRAVETILAEFFTLEADGWHQKRCDEEIGQATAQADTNRRIAEEREAKRRQRIEHESSHAPMDNDSSTKRSPASVGEREPSQTPDSRLQTPDKRTPPRSPKPDGRFAEFWAAWPKSPRKGGKPEAFGVWRNKELEREAPAILAHVRAMAKTDGWTKQGGEYVPGPVVYLRGRRWDGAEAAHAGNGQAPPPDWRDSRAEVQAHGVELGLGRYHELDDQGHAAPWESYRRRVIAAFEAKEGDHAPHP